MYFSKFSLSLLLHSHCTKGNYHLELGIHQFHRCLQILLQIYRKTTHSLVWGDFNSWNEFNYITSMLLQLAASYSILYSWDLSIFIQATSVLSFPHLHFFFLILIFLAQHLIGISWWTSILIMLSFFLFSFSEIESTLMSISGIFWVRELTLAGVCMPQLFSPFRAELKC